MKSNRAFAAATEKVTSSKVKVVSWSPKFDLLAAATESAKLFLFRLITKEKVWVISGPDNDAEIISMCWRPDGKVIAVSYSNPDHGVQFICMETHTRCRKFNLDLEQTSTLLRWVDVNCSIQQSFTDLGINSKEFLPNVPIWQPETNQKKKLTANEPVTNSFNVLSICDDMCRIFLLANGLFPIILVDYSDSNILSASSILDLHLNSELSELLVAVTSPNEDGLESTWLKSMHLQTEPIDMMSFKAATEKAFEILSLEAYLGEILNTVTEECDVVSQGMETHLINHFAKYAKSTDCIGEDLLQMLIWGSVPYHLRSIFEEHVTKRDIKKLISLTESTYTKIQQDLTLNFQNALMNLYYHLTELKGVTLGSKGVLPLSVDDIQNLLDTACALMFKTAELLQVIDASLKNFNLFFRWLYVRTAQIRKEPVDHVALVPNKDMIFVADFINENFSFRSQSDSKSGKQFQLDKVNQYLKNEDLVSPTEVENNEWLELVLSKVTLSDSKIIVKPQSNRSLRQLFDNLSDQISNVIRLPKFTDAQSFKSSHKIELFRAISGDACSVRFWTKTQTTGVINRINCESTYAFGVKNNNDSTEAVMCMPNAHPYDSLSVRFSFEDNSDETLVVRDFQPYNDTTVTLLLNEWGHKFYLAQMKITSVIEYLQQNGLVLRHSTASSLIGTECPWVDALPLCRDVRELDMRQDFVSIAVTGSRKVSCVLASDARTIYPFMMDSRDEEDEDDEESSMSSED